VTSKGTAIIILSFFEKMTRKRKNFKKDEKKMEKKGEGKQHALHKR